MSKIAAKNVGIYGGGGMQKHKVCVRASLNIVKCRSEFCVC